MAHAAAVERGDAEGPFNDRTVLLKGVIRNIEYHNCKVSVPGTALLTRIDEGALERVSSEGIGVEPGGQQGFDLGE